MRGEASTLGPFPFAGLDHLQLCINLSALQLYVATEQCNLSAGVPYMVAH